MSKSGTVVGLIGKAWARGTDGSLRALSVGDELAGTETLILAAGASITINYGSHAPDGAEVVTFTAPENGEFTILRPDQHAGQALPPELVRIADDTFMVEDLSATDFSQPQRMGDGHRFVELVDISRMPETDAIAPLNLMPIETDIRPMTIAGANAPAEDTDWTYNDGPARNLPVNRAPEAAPEVRIIQEDKIATGNVLENDIDPENRTLTVTQFEVGGQIYLAGQTAKIPGVGSILLNANGSYSFTPVADWSGAAPTVLYIIDDGRGGTAASTLDITVEPVTDIDPDVITTHAGNSVTLNVLDNDTFENSDAKVSAITQGAHGTTVINPDGTITYTPNAGYVGPDSYTYTVISGGILETATVTVNVTNALPASSPEQETTPEDTPVSGNVLDNDTDADGDRLTMTQFEVGGEVYLAGQTATIPGVGTLVLEPGGHYIFTPAKDWNGAAPTITYTVTDGNQGGITTATLDIEVTPVNDVPMAGPLPERSDADADVVTKLDVKAGFSDIDGDTLTYTATGLPGGLTLDPNTGLISGTIDNSASQSNTPGDPLGTYTVVVTANDGHGGTATQSFTWVIGNPTPNAAHDLNTTSEDAPLAVNAAQGVLGNDSDPDGDALTVSAVEGVAANVGAAVTGSNGGSFRLKADGSYDFDPTGQFDDLAVGETRTTSVSYTVSDGEGGTDTATLEVTVTGVNDAPVAITTLPAQASADADAIANLDITTAFADGDASDTLTYTATGLPGGLTLDPDTGLISGTIDASASQSGTPGNPLGTYTVIVTADDGHGGTATQAFTWTVTNPAPNAAHDLNTTSEDALLTVSAAQGVLGNDSDPDGDALAVSAINGSTANVGTAVTGSNGGTFTLKADGSYNFDPAGQFDDLSVGETRTTSISYTVSDGEGGTDTATLEVTVTGTNDAPLAASALPAQSSLDADAVANLDITTAFADVDASDVLTYTATGLPGGLTLDPNTGLISGTIDASASQSGTPGNPLGTYTVIVTAADGHGGTATQAFTWTVANPAPNAAHDLNTTSEDTLLTVSAAQGVLGNDSDPDGDALTVSAINGSTANVGTAVTGSNGGSFTLKADGSYDFDPTGQFNDLAVGETRTTSISYTVSDGEGGTDTATLTVTVTGVNDAPVALDDANTTSEEALLTVSAAQGVLGNDSDPDGDTLTVSAINGSTANVGTAVTGSNGGSFTLKADGSYDFDPTGQFDDLAVGETRTTSISYTISDGEGGTDTATLTVTVTGVNDAPVAITTLPAQASADADAVANLDITTAFADVDASDTLTYTATGLPAGLTLDPNTGLISGTIDNSASQSNTPGDPLGTYTVIVTADDGHGGTATQSFTWVIANPAPNAAHDLNTTSEDALLTVSAAQGVLGNDSDPDGDALTVSAINGSTANVGAAVTGSNGGSFRLKADGSYDFDPTGQFDDLAVGETRTTSVSYTVSDGEGGTDTATLEVTVTGVNDAPVAITTLPAQASADADAIANLDITTAFADGDASDTLTYTATGLPGGLTLDPDTGLISGTIDASASQSGTPGNPLGTYTVIVTADDGHGGTATQSFTWTVANPAPNAAHDLNTTSEEALLTVSAAQGVLGNDSDPDGDALAVSAINGSTANVGTAVTGSNGGTFTLKADGSYNFDPTGQFDDLAVGETRTTSISYTISDGEGGTDTATLEVTVTGVNDAPVALDDANTTAEDAPLAVNAAQGVLGNDSDPDGDALTVSAVEGVAANVGAAVTGSNGGTFTLKADGSYDFDPTGQFDDLAVGETRTTSISYTVSDGEGGTDTATLTVTVTGTNDAPFAAAPLPAQSSLDTDAVANLDITTAFADVDASDTLTYTATGLPAGLTLDPNTGLISGTIDPSASQSNTPGNPLGTYTVIVTADDGHGGTATQSVTWVIANPAPEAKSDQGSVTEDGPDLVVSAANGVIRSAAAPAGADSDPDGDALEVTHVISGTASGFSDFPGSENAGAQIVGTYGTLTLNAEGSYTYVLDNNNWIVNGLDETSPPLSDVFSYAISDGEGGRSFASLTITINGSDDGAPTIAPVDGNGHAAGQATVHEAGLTTDGPAGENAAASGSIALSASNGLANVTIGGTTLTLAQLEALTTGSPVEIDTPQGKLALTGYVSSGEIGGVSIGGTLSYTYFLENPITNPDAAPGNQVEAIPLSVEDVAGQNSTASLGINIVDDAPSISAPSAVTVDEANLADGTNPDTDILTRTGSLDIRTGADNGSVSMVFDAAQTAPAGLTSNGAQLIYVVSADGHTLTATAGSGGPEVFAVTLTNPGSATAGYSFVLSGTLDHSTTDIDLSFAFTVTDADGDTASSSVQVTVVDDGPVAVDQPGVSLSEGSVAIGSESGGVNLLGNDAAGADGSAKVVSIIYTNEAGNSATAAVPEEGVTVDTRYGSLTVNPDGTWNYTSDATENNPSSVTDDFSYTIEDNDGSTATAVQPLTVTDTGPVAAPVSLSIDEQNTPGAGSAGSPDNSVTQNLAITKAADAISDVVFSAATVSGLEAQNLTSGGAALVYTVSGDGHTLTATAAGAKIFTLTLNNPTDATGTSQHVTMTLTGPLDHATANSENILSIPVAYTVHDTDSSISASLNLTVVDDVPTAHSDLTSVSVTEGGQTVIGASLLSNDVQGSDGAHVHQIQYTNEAGQLVTGTVAAGASGSTFDTIHGSLTVRQDGSWSYTSDPAANSGASVNHSQSGNDLFVNDVFNYNLIDGDKDVSGWASQTIRVNDTAPSIGTPETDTLNEANLPSGTDPRPSALTQTGSLAIIKAADGIDVAFSTTQAALQALNLTSGGAALVYTVSADRHTLTATAAAGGPVVFTATIENPTAATARYKFVLSRALDHGSGEEIVLPIAYGVSDADGDAASSSFTIKILDDQPEANRTFTLNEDSPGITFNTSADASDSNLTTSAPAHGTVTVNSEGAITYKPAANFSGTDTFTYTTTADDGSNLTTNVTVIVNPVSDAPQMTVNAAAVQTNEDVAIALGLNAPVVTDATDQNGAGTAGDNPELLSAITLSGIPAGATLLDGAGQVLAVSDGTPITIQLSDGNHIAGLVQPGLTLTTAQYEALQILPPQESHANFTITVTVTSHEVGDDRIPISGVAGATTLRTVKVNVQAVTDPVELSLKDGNDGDGLATDHTFAEDTSFNLSDLLSVAFGSTDGNTARDVDGSEVRWFEIAGLPIGTTVNNVEVTAENPVITVQAPGLSRSATGLPAMEITPPLNFSGDVTITITLKAQDADADGIGGSATKGAVESSVVTLNLHVTPVGGDVTASDISTVEDTPAAFLSGVAVTDGGANGSELITQVKFEVPAGWTVSDTGHGNGYTTNLAGTTYTISFDATLTEAEREAVLDDFRIAPPGNSSADQTIAIKVTTADTVRIKGSDVTETTTTTLPIKITVTPVAETVRGDSNADNIDDVTMAGDHTYTTAGAEDIWFTLGTDGGFNLKDGWSNQDEDEQLFARLTPELIAGDGGANDANGAQFRYSTNGDTSEIGGAWVSVPYSGTPVNVPVAYLDTLQFKAPQDLSGSFRITVEAYTIDTDPDTGATVKAISGSAVLSNLIIEPVADDVTVALNARIAGVEDTPIPLDIRPTSSDPSETFTVTIYNIPAGAQLYYNGVLQTVASGSVTIQEFDASKSLALQPPSSSNQNFTLDVSAHSVDGNARSTPQHLTVEVSLKGVADGATLTSTKKTYSEDELDSGSDQVLLKELVSLSLNDNDTSEVLTLRVTGLPESFDLSEGTMLVNGTGTERIWLLTQQQFNTAEITTPANFSGTQSFTVTPITTENDGNSLTGTSTTAEFTVTPSTEATVTTSAMLDEDTRTPLGLGIAHRNGDTDETLTTVWVAKEDANSANFTLYLGATKLSEAGLDTESISGQDYYVLTGAQITQLAAQGASNLDGALGSFDFKYEITDARYGTASAGASHATVHDGSFELTANPVTDQVDVSITNIAGGAGTTLVSDADANDDASPDTAVLSAGDLVTVTLNIATVSDTASAGGIADADGSEKVIRVVIEGVPNGVSVQGAEYNGGGTWLLIYEGTDALPINNTGGISLPVVFDVGEFAINVNNVPITMQVQTQDRGDQFAETAIEFDTVVWHLSTNFEGGEGPTPAPTPAHIVQWDYNNTHATEDAGFSLSDIIDAQVVVADPSVPNTFTVSLMNVPHGTTIEGMRMTMVNGQEVWTASATVLPGGDANAVLQSLLKAIKVTPPANTNENNAAGTFHFDASLTASVPGGKLERAFIEDMTVPVNPVTDAGVISISAATINEGVASIPVTITVSNDADGSHGTITDGKLYVKVDAAGSTNGLENGTLTLNGAALTTEMVAGVQYYVITGVTPDTPINLVYSPHNSTAGQVSFSALVRTQEYGSSQVQIGTASDTAQVSMINNGVAVTSAPSSGVESNPVQISGLVVDLIDNDGSENIQFILLSNVPNGFLVYVGDSAGSATLASNAGSETWVISNPDGSLPAYVAIVPPEHWSGTLDNLTVMVSSRESAFREQMLQSFDLADFVINPVADGVALAPTNSFGPENQIIALNLNASMADAADASVPGATDAYQETTTLKLKGLGEFASFYIGATEKTAGVSYEAATDTYTLENLTQSDLDQLGFLQARSALTDQNGATAGIQIRVEAFTTDGPSTSALDTDYMTVNPFAQVPTGGNDTLLWTGNMIDAGAGIDTVNLRNGESLLGSELDSKLSNVEVLALHGNEITSLSASDVLGITGDSGSILTIQGDGEVSLTLGAGWASAGTQETGGIGYAVYTATMGATGVELHIQNGITVD